jgi:hypothetical protein
VSDPARRAALGREGRETAMRLFSRTRLCEKLLPVYESLASSSHT